jgi:hypothetical protein
LVVLGRVIPTFASMEERSGDNDIPSLLRLPLVELRIALVCLRHRFLADREVALIGEVPAPHLPTHG